MSRFIKAQWKKIGLLLQNSDIRVKLGIIGFVVGIAAGFASLFLNYGLRHLEHFFSTHIHGIAFSLLPIAGLLLTVVFLKYIVKDFGGHGLPEVIHSISLKGGNLKLRSSFSKLLGALITISTGGSAGPEAPIVVSGASIGSNFARLFNSDEKSKIAVTGAGAAAAIAAIFNAPITGIIFTMEVIIGEWAPMYMFPVVIASVTGTELSRLFNGNQIPFSHTILKVGTLDIFLSVVLAVFTALASLLFIRFMRNSSGYFGKYLKNDLTKAMVGGTLVGILIYFVPYVKGEGYGLVQTLISGQFSGGIFLLFSIILLKIVVTSLTLGSGGAGGVFAPSLLIGSATGVLFYTLTRYFFPSLELADPSLFALIGMSGVISGTLAAPLTGMFLIIEITAGYDAILPLMLVSFISTTLVKLYEKHSIYHDELVRKGYLHRPRTDGKILSDIRIEELLERDMMSVKPDQLLRDILPIIKQSPRNYFPVVDSETQNFFGMVYFNDIKEFIFNSTMLDTIFVEEIMHTDLTTISSNDNLLHIQQLFDRTKLWSLPVVDNGTFRGLISKATMLDLYRKELKVQTDR